MKTLMFAFLISIVLVALINTEANLKGKALSLASEENLKVKTENLKTKATQSDNTLQQQMFSALPTAACAQDPNVMNAQIAKNASSAVKKTNQFQRAVKSDMWWVKNWGYGQSAYLFDFLSDNFLTSFTTEAQAIYNALKAIDNTKDGLYTDPYDYKLFITDDMTDDEKAKVLADFTKINQNYVQPIFDSAINAVQLHNGMKIWKWNYDSTLSDYSGDFVTKYDADGDGRLNIRELLLGVIDQNSKFLGENVGANMFNSTAMKFKAMFAFIDCDSDGYISAEEVWKNLKKLVRPKPNNHNIFLYESMRISSVNDFILKNHISKNGLLSEKEFISALLLGFWNRQTTPLAVLTDNSRSLMNLRWNNNTDDIAAIAATTPPPAPAASTSATGTTTAASRRLSRILTK